MKPIFLFLFTIGLLTGISSCKEDVPSASPFKSGFSVNGTTYKLAKGFLEDEGTENYEGNTYHIWGLTLTSAGISWDETNGASGQGEAVYVYLYAANDNSKLPAGTYQSDLIAGEDLVEAEETFVLINYNVESLSGDFEYLDFKDARVVVTKSGNKHKIIFDLTTEDGQPISGGFEGELVVID